MSVFLVSVAVVAVAEIGDKTMLLSLALAARYRRPMAVLLGIAVATLANHGLAAGLGTVAGQWLDPKIMAGIVGLSFLAMAGWALTPDKGSDVRVPRFGAFAATAIAFFLAEMADKTQLATVALAARYGDMAAVTLGTTIGMIVANAPVVFLGSKAAARLPLQTIRLCAAAMFAALGALALYNAFTN
jgi:Ca2+/H+ antiporter, TMEM165/GDT1 family